MAKSLFIDNTGTTPALTAFGGIVAIFGGIALAKKYPMASINRANTGNPKLFAW